VTALLEVLIAIVVLFGMAIAAARAGNLTFQLRKKPAPSKEPKP